MSALRVASRRSALALTQTQWVIHQLEGHNPGTEFSVVPVVTKGDQILDVALSKVGGKGLFVTEVEQTLLDGLADFAVHSLKDVPASLADGLVLAAIPPREDARDALISRDGRTLKELPEGAIVGTSSLRRIAQLRRIRPDIVLRPLRGNIDTRLKKLDSGEMDAVVLAAAGLRRMGWAQRITEHLDVRVCLPAIGQGILGIEGRADDESTLTLLHSLEDPAARTAALAERTLLQHLNGSCQVPIGGYATVLENGQISLRGLVGNADGSELLEAAHVGTDPIDTGRTVAEKLRDLGADRLLADLGAPQG